MTENQLGELDLFYRQSILGSGKVPFLLCSGCVRNDDDVLRRLHLEAQVGVGEIGSGKRNLPVSEDAIQAQSLPHASKYLICSEDLQTECRLYKYNTTCWIPRDDVTPPTKQ